MTKLCVLGPSGRMGKMVLLLAAARDDIDVVAVVDHPSSDLIGQELNGTTVSSDINAAMAASDVYIDFTTPASTEAAATAAALHNTAAVVGTTGLGESAMAALDTLARSAPVLIASNFSLGVNLLFLLAESAARALGPEFDLEVMEIHHRRKRDSPSGTALSLGESLAAGRGVSLANVGCFSRHGDVGPRTADEIGIVALRGGDVIGEHTAYLLGDRERIEITHRAQSREIFADGALRTASWLVGREPGTYNMRDVLGLG